MPVRELPSLPGTDVDLTDARQASLAVNLLPVMEEPLGKAQSVKGLISTDDTQTALRAAL